jgi:DNA-binding CsgD family transcriptional regulator
VLYNGLARHAEALEATRSAFERDHAGFGPFLVPELVEAAARTGDTASLSAALDWLTERTATTPSDWSLGIELRIRALMSEGETADTLYRRSLDHLQRTRIRTELARAHLVYAEWLRRQGRRSGARGQSRTAHRMFTDMGMKAFAERARVELAATGENVRKRTVETRDELTPQEGQIAALARDGLSSREIAARLFLSPRTVEWHLGHVFRKLGIRSRRELSRTLPSAESERSRAPTP